MKFFMIFIGYILGIDYPDIDIKIKFLKHRSFFTHSPILTIIIYYLWGDKSSDLIYILSGFSFAVGVHLAFDLFPKKWTGGSIIKPFGGVLFSKIYIFFGSLISFFFGLKIAGNLDTYMILSILGIIAVFIYSKKEKTLLRPLILYIIVIFIFGSLYFQNFVSYVTEYFQGIGEMIKL